MDQEISREDWVVDVLHEMEVLAASDSGVFFLLFFFFFCYDQDCNSIDHIIK